jgi:hypothetical protein
MQAFAVRPSSEPLLFSKCYPATLPCHKVVKRSPAGGIFCWRRKFRSQFGSDRVDVSLTKAHDREGIRDGFIAI